MAKNQGKNKFSLNFFSAPSAVSVVCFFLIDFIRLSGKKGISGWRSETFPSAIRWELNLGRRKKDARPGH
jgi:hypothetical protein